MSGAKGKRLRVVKKNPSIKTYSHKKVHSTVYIKTSTPYVSGIKRINKFLAKLEQQSAKYVTVLGMGKSTEKTLAMGLYFENTKQKKVEVFTRTVDVLDEVVVEDSDSGSDHDSDSDDEHKETTMHNRKLTGIELRIYP